MFVSNGPHYWKKVQVKKGLLRSGHDMIIAYPKNSVKAVRTDMFFRDVGDHRKHNMFRQLDTIECAKMLNDDYTPDQMTALLCDTLWPKFVCD